LKAAIRKFNKLCLTTLIAVYFLILVGGVVRSTGSGMGCPDWPKCFGRWIPPTSVADLPVDYKDSYASNREKKNRKFAALLSTIGLTETAQKLLADESVLIESDFNASKTWIEYLNRLVGVVIGFLVILVVWQSFKLRSQEPQLFWLSVITLIGVLFQGWFGSIVVSTNLTQWTITIHMFLALVIVFFLILIYFKSKFESPVRLSFNVINGLLVCCIVVVLVQIFFGTQVREEIDRIASSFNRPDWISNLGVDFIVHRSFSWGVLLLNLLLVYRLRKTKIANTLSTALITVILASILSGVIMAYLSIPAFVQPVHLLLASVIFGIQILLVLKLNTSDSRLLYK
jgi:cytochrome c oxidase assembly protein subunit 15